MEKDFFDKILDQVIEEASTIYVENEKIEASHLDDIEFSDIHKQKMKNLFKEIKREESRKKAVRLTKKIAVIVLCALVITAGLVTSVQAWREQVVKFIMKNNDDNYMSIKFGDDSEEELNNEEVVSGDDEENAFIIDDMKFLYLPDGFKFYEKELRESFIFYSFINRSRLYSTKERYFCKYF